MKRKYGTLPRKNMLLDELNPDIIYKIALHLKPQDLGRLLSTSKGFRNYFNDFDIMKKFSIDYCSIIMRKEDIYGLLKECEDMYYREKNDSLFFFKTLCIYINSSECNIENDAVKRYNEHLVLLFTFCGLLDFVGFLLQTNLEREKLQGILYSALQYGHSDICKLLLLKYKFDEETLTTALSSCYENIDIDICKTLINRGADVNKGDPLHRACCDHNFELCNILIENGAKINVRNKQNGTPIHCTFLLLSRRNLTKSETNDLDAGLFKICEYLIKNGADLLIKNNDGFTVLQMAVKLKKYDLCKMLVKHIEGVSDISDALHIATIEGSYIICKLLIHNCADVNNKDVNGNTSLHHAAINGFTEICYLLLDNGANPKIRNNLGLLPYHLADEENHYETYDLLNKK